jgi:hypothetical protein
MHAIRLVDIQILLRPQEYRTTYLYRTVLLCGVRGSTLVTYFSSRRVCRLHSKSLRTSRRTYIVCVCCQQIPLWDCIGILEDFDKSAASWKG